MSELQAAYQSAFETDLIVQHESPGVIELRGADRLDLLHRLSTNDLENMPADHMRRTVFTDPVGRMIDVVTVLNLADKLLIMTSSGRSQSMQDWLQGHIFFQDDVTVSVTEGEWSLYGAYGPKASDSLPSEVPDAEALIADSHGIVWPINRPVPGFLYLMNPDQAAENWTADPLASEVFEILRIEAGLPKTGAEIRDDSIPLEVGLWDEVSFVKGCYVGQEIIARMESRGKLAKQLVGIRLDTHVQTGSTLRQDGRTVGTVTSVVESPRLGWIGLASGRPSALENDDGRVEIGESEQIAFVVELPFAGLETPAPA